MKFIIRFSIFSLILLYSCTGQKLGELEQALIFILRREVIKKMRPERFTMTSPAGYPSLDAFTEKYLTGSCDNVYQFILFMLRALGIPCTQIICLRIVTVTSPKFNFSRIPFFYEEKLSELREAGKMTDHMNIPMLLMVQPKLLLIIKLQARDGPVWISDNLNK